MINKEDYYKNLPKKRMGVGVVFFNHKDELLIVKPTYKDHWVIPGGVIETNESPLQAGIREVMEEINIKMEHSIFLSVDYWANTQEPWKGEALQFVFYGGRLTTKRAAEIKLPTDELSEFRFLRPEQAFPLMSEGLSRRLKKSLAALHNNLSVYLEEGQ